MQRMNGLMYLTVATALVSLAVPAMAGITPTQLPIADAWSGAPALATTSTPDTDSTVSNGGNGAVALTFTTGPTGFTLDKFAIVAAGGPGDVTVSLYQSPVGGTEGDGYVNVSYSNDLFTGEAYNGGTPGLSFTFNGTGSETILELDLTGSDEIALLPNTVYALDFTGLNGFYVRRGGEFYTDGGNLYARSSPDDLDGQRFDVAGGRRDAPLALYAVPEPASLGLIGVGGLLLTARRNRKA